MNVLAQGSELRADFSIGTDNRLASEYYYRVRGSRFFVAPGGFFDQQTLDFYNNGNQALFQYKVREGGGYADAGYVVGRDSELRLGYKISHLQTYVSSGTPDLAPLSGMVGATRLRFVHDGMDNVVPNRGLHVVFDGQWVNRWPGARKQFPILQSEISWATSFRERYTLLNVMSGGTTLNHTGTGLPPFWVGGPLWLSALAPRQFLGNSYYLDGLYLMRALSTERLSMLSRFRALIGYELGNAFLSGDPPKPFHDGVIGVVGQTGLGIIFFGGSLGEHGERKVVFRLGRFF
jgi:NTE family protein